MFVKNTRITCKIDVFSMMASSRLNQCHEIFAKGVLETLLHAELN